jgi:hypothetical protein
MNRQERLDHAGHLQQWGGTRLVELTDGAERGVRAVEFRTAAGLEFAALVDRGMDIGWARYQGRSLAWHSPTGFTAPAFREIDGLGFLRSFGGGLFTTAGLDHILFPQVDPNDTYNYPAREATEYGLHGRVSNTPGSLRGYGERWDGDVCTLYAEGEVRQAGALAENLVLRRRIETTLDGRGIRWIDEVVNEGRQPGPHMLLYHINIGAPLVGPNTRIGIPSRGVDWATPTADPDSGEHLVITPPTAGFAEQAFLHRVAAAGDGTVEVVMVNEDDPARPWGISLRYRHEAMPHFLQWRLLDVGNYVVGLEPATNGPSGREANRAAGDLILLEPDEGRAYETSITVLDGGEECTAALERVEQVRAAAA